MNVQVIYDLDGDVITVKGGATLPEPPNGVPYLETILPEGKHVVGVDVSVTPHQVILEDIPPSEIDRLRAEMEQRNAVELESMRLEMARNNAELFETVIMLTGGGM